MTASRERAAGPAAPPLHVLHVVSSLAPTTGGPSASVPGLCAALAQAGCRVTLTAVGPEAAAEALAAREAGVELQLMRPTPSGPLIYSRELAQRLPEFAAAADVIHVHGLWQSPGWLAGSAARRLHKPLVISPRGFLEPWSLTRSRLKKRIAAALFDNRNLRAAACLHATAAAEAAACRAYGLRCPVAIIPNGVELPDEGAAAGAAAYYERQEACRGKRNALFLSRLHPKKGLPDLLAAWSSLAQAHTDWHLTIAGPDEGGYLATVLQGIEELGLQQAVSCVGPLHGPEKAAALREAELVVLPTYSENFGMVVAEALAAATPVLTTRGAPWEGLPAHGCGWWVPVGADGVREGLAAALACPPEHLREMGRRGRQWALAAFTWPAIAEAMRDTYLWLLGRGPRPDCVQAGPPDCVQVGPPDCVQAGTTSRGGGPGDRP